MKRVCYGRKEVGPAETCAYKNIFDKETSPIKSLETQPYNLRVQRKQQDQKKIQRKDHDQKKEKITNNSLFSSFPIAPKKNEASFGLKKILKRKPVKAKLPKLKLRKLTRNTRCMKIINDEEAESEISRASNLRGSLFSTSIGSVKRISTYRTKRKLRTRPVKNKAPPIKSKKGKREKRSKIQSKKRRKHHDSYTEKMNQTLSKINQHKLTIEQQRRSEKHKIKKKDVEKDKSNSGIKNLRNFNFHDARNIDPDENPASNRDPTSSQSSTNAENLMEAKEKSRKKYFTPTIRRGKKFPSFSPFLSSNIVHKKNKFKFHEKSHTSPSKCSKKLNESLSKSYRSGKNLDLDLLSQTIDSRNALLKEKKIDCLNQSTQHLYYPKILAKQLRVVLDRVKVPKLFTEGADEIVPENQVKSKTVKKRGRKKRVAQKRGKNKNQLKNVDQPLETDIAATLAPAKNLQENASKPLKEAEQYAPILLEKKKRECVKQKTQIFYSPRILRNRRIQKNEKELRVVPSKLNLSEVATEGADKIFPENQVKLKNEGKKKVVQKKDKNKSQQQFVNKPQVTDTVALPLKDAKQYALMDIATKLKDTCKLRQTENESVKLKEKKHIKDKTDLTYLVSLKKLQVNLTRMTKSELLRYNIGQSLSKTLVSKLKKKNIKIKKKPAKKGRNKKGTNKKNLSTKNTIVESLKNVNVNPEKSDLSKLANREYCQLHQEKVIETNKENSYPTFNYSLMPSNKQALDFTGVKKSKEISDKSHDHPSLSQCNNSENIIIRNKNSSLNQESVLVPKTTFFPTKQLARLNVSKSGTEHFSDFSDVSLDISTENINLSNRLPFTSTPLTSRKNMRCRKVNLALNKFNQISSSYLKTTLSQVMSSNSAVKKLSKDIETRNLTNVSNCFSGNKNKEINFEDSLTAEISKVRSRQYKSLNINKTDFLDKVYDRNILHKSHVVSKSYSSTEKSIFLKSQSSLEVTTGDSTNELNLKKLLVFCNQTAVWTFPDIYTWKSVTVKKVGEGSYGECFILKNMKKKVVIKVIPMSNSPNDNLQPLESVYSEMRVCSCLNALRENPKNRTKNFNLMREAWIVQGKVPEVLLKAWDEYEEEKETYNQRLDVYEDHALFAIMELEFGGTDLSFYQLKNALEAESIFKQIAISLAIAEETNLFEHRDLHVGNILIQRTNKKKICYVIRGSSISIASNGVLVNIIDFTLSRILDCGVVLFNDLEKDEAIFNQFGDLQFDIYRATREQLKHHWHESLLFTNVLWLQYLCNRLLSSVYLNSRSVMHKKSMQNIENFAKKLPKCQRALSIIESCGIAVVPDEVDPTLIKLNAIAKYIDKGSLMK